MLEDAKVRVVPSVREISISSNPRSKKRDKTTYLDNILNKSPRDS